MPPFSATHGKQLFEQNCAGCHDIRTDKVGPALKNLHGAHTDPTWIYRWVRNPGKLITSHDPDAEAVFNKYNRIQMPGFPTFTDQDITDIGGYIVGESFRLDSLDKVKAVSKASIGSANLNDQGGLSQNMLVWVVMGAGLVVIVLIVAVSLEVLVLEVKWAKKPVSSAKNAP